MPQTQSRAGIVDRGQVTLQQGDDADVGRVARSRRGRQEPLDRTRVDEQPRQGPIRQPAPHRLEFRQVAQTRFRRAAPSAAEGPFRSITPWIKVAELEKAKVPSG